MILKSVQRKLILYKTYFVSFHIDQTNQCFGNILFYFHFQKGLLIIIYYKFCWINNILNPLNVTVNMMKWAESGWAEANFLWGAIVNSEKWILKNSQNLLNKSPKHGGASAPQLRPPWADLLDIPIAIDISFELLKLEGN